MRISDTISQLVLPNGQAPRKLLQNMQPGQQLQATVVSLDKPTVARLSMGPIEVLAHTKIPLSVGQRITMEVVKGGEMPELRLLRETTIAELKARVLRQILPNQTLPARLLEGLRSLQTNLPQANQAFETLAKLPPSLPGLAQGKPTAPPPGTTAPPAPAPESPSSQARPTPDALNTLRTLMVLGSVKVTPQLVTTLHNLVANAKSQQLPSDFIKVVQQFLAQPKEKLSPELLNAAQRLVTPPKEGITSERPLPPQGQSTPVTTTENKAAPALEKAVQSLLARILPGDSRITPTQIRRSLLESGLFLESRLAAGEAPVNDFKANLLRLLFLLRPVFGPESGQPGTPPATEPRIPAGTVDNAIARLFTDLLRQSEGSLARVQTHQLNSLPSEDGTRQVWQFEIPIQHRERIDDFLIRLEQERVRKEGQDETIWKLTLNFDIQPLGPVAARLSLQGEEISSLFQAEQAESAALIERHLPQLNDALIRAGLKVGRLHAHHGEITEDVSGTQAPSVTLLDERA
jgi:hypothetical protein